MALQPGPDHLHRLAAGEGAQGGHEGLQLEQLPQPLGAALGQGVGDGDGAAQAGHLAWE